MEKDCNIVNSRGGKGTKYGPEWTDELKSAVRRRDGQRCVVCGKTNAAEAQREGFGLSVHHIDHDKSNSRMSNLVTVCQACHGKRIHGKTREAWKATLKEILRGSSKKHSWSRINLGAISKRHKKHKNRMKKAKAKSYRRYYATKKANAKKARKDAAINDLAATPDKENA